MTVVDLQSQGTSGCPLASGGVTKAGDYSLGVGGYWRPLFWQLDEDIRLGSAIWRDTEVRSANGNRIGSFMVQGDNLVIKGIDPGSRAERVGLRVGDVLLPQDEDALADERAEERSLPGTAAHRPW